MPCRFPKEKEKEMQGVSGRDDKEVFKRIFRDHWLDFKRIYPYYDCAQYNTAVEKMLGCGEESGGYSEYLCLHCGDDLRRICFSCKSSFCLSCSSGYVDNVVSQVSSRLHAGVIYRHVVLTLPESLRQHFYDQRKRGSFLSGFMKLGYLCLESLLEKLKGEALKIGCIVVVQTHGRSGHYNPHLHIIMTDGGINPKNGKWVKLGYFPYPLLHKKWQYFLLSWVKKELGPSVKSLVDELWKRYPDGLVAYVTKGQVPENCKGLARYLAKYVASPPISLNRILNYDGESVRYWYNDHETKAKKVETLPVLTFIGRMVQHIMAKGFQRIRYYGLQATKTFQKWKTAISAGMRQVGKVLQGAYEVIGSKSYRKRYQEKTLRDPLICQACGHEMELSKLWHPKYGVIYEIMDHLEIVKEEKHEIIEPEAGSSFWTAPTAIQLSIFPMLH